ncbi:MAG: hypothetical protein PHE83_04540 [Opitutaceae bacterium]|nr:hypothetical protein [Opitutaceae bacterium]
MTDLTARFAAGMQATGRRRVNGHAASRRINRAIPMPEDIKAEHRIGMPPARRVRGRFAGGTPRLVRRPCS